MSQPIVTQSPIATQPFAEGPSTHTKLRWTLRTRHIKEIAERKANSDPWAQNKCLFCNWFPQFWINSLLDLLGLNSFLLVIELTYWVRHRCYGPNGCNCPMVKIPCIVGKHIQHWKGQSQWFGQPGTGQAHCTALASASTIFESKSPFDPIHPFLYQKYSYVFSTF